MFELRSPRLWRFSGITVIHVNNRGRFFSLPFPLRLLSDFCWDGTYSMYGNISCCGNATFRIQRAELITIGGRRGEIGESGDRGDDEILKAEFPVAVGEGEGMIGVRCG